MKMASAAGLASVSWGHRLAWLDAGLVAAEAERLDSGARPRSEWVCPNELPSFP